MAEEKEILKGYISDSVEISSTAPLELDVLKALGRPAKVGYLTSDDGDIDVQINGLGAPKIPLKIDETLEFEKDDEWEISKLIVTTASLTDLTIRYLLRYVGKVAPLSGKT